MKNNGNYTTTNTNTNPDDSKNKDFTKELGFEQIYDSLVEENNKDYKSDTQLKVEGKIEKVLRFYHEIFIKSLKKVDESNFIDFNSNLVKVCREFCANYDIKNFESNEKMCLKNCGSKYIHQYKMFNYIEKDLLAKFGSLIFVHSEDEKERMTKLYNMIEKERMDNLKI